jgi:UrcA family protein
MLAMAALSGLERRRIMRTPTMLATFAAIAFAGLAVLPAAAATPEAPRASVRYADLNLDGGAGASAMLRRINLAARDVCGARTGPMPLTERIRTRRCVRAETEAAVADLGNANVTALFYRRARVTIAQT